MIPQPSRPAQGLCRVARFVACAILVVTIGCQAPRTEHSGFLGDYAGLTPSEEVEGAYIVRHAGKSLKDYDKFMIDPVIVHFAPNAKGIAVDPAKLKILTDLAHEETVNALSQRYSVVQAPGPGVLRIRAALTDIKKTKPAMNIHPATKLSGIGLGGASMEAEAIDTQSGERVFAVVDMRQGNRLSIAPGLDTYGHAKQVIKHWVKRFVGRVDAAHGFEN